MLKAEREDQYLAGGQPQQGVLADQTYSPYSKNLTPDPETGLGLWKDDEILRAIRDGISRNGRYLAYSHPADAYSKMSDEDARAVVAYLRTIPPIHQDQLPLFNPRYPFFLCDILYRDRGITPTQNISTPNRDDRTEYGGYVANVAACTRCHRDVSHQDVLIMSGGFRWHYSEVGFVVPANLTPDPETGIGRFTPDDIKKVLRTGRGLDGRRLAPTMSLFTPHHGGMTEADLDALTSFLFQLSPVNRKVSKRHLYPTAAKLLSDGTKN